MQVNHSAKLKNYQSMEAAIGWMLVNHKGVQERENLQP
jgi:hypothetical protein